MRVLFLDVDGVLNNQIVPPYVPLRPALISVVNKVCADTGAVIVVSSAWRVGPHGGKDGCRAKLRAGGVTAKFHRDWRTGYCAGGDRGAEIAEWLSRNPVTSFAIVDDEYPGLGDRFPERFVQTDGAVGISEYDADHLRMVLLTDIEPMPRPQYHVRNPPELPFTLALRMVSGSRESMCDALEAFAADLRGGWGYRRIRTVGDCVLKPSYSDKFDEPATILDDERSRTLLAKRAREMRVAS